MGDPVYKYFLTKGFIEGFIMAQEVFNREYGRELTNRGESNPDVSLLNVPKQTTSNYSNMANYQRYLEELAGKSAGGRIGLVTYSPTNESQAFGP